MRNFFFFLFLSFFLLVVEGCLIPRHFRSSGTQKVAVYSGNKGASKKADVVSFPVEYLSRFCWPLSHIQVTSRFGQRGKRFHEGVDLRARANTPVFASQSGTVLYSDSRIRGYGKMIVIRHDNNISTIYAHNSKLMVKKGQHVRVGQRIALSGSTGRSYGPHLHFEIRYSLGAIDPLGVMPSLRQLTSNHLPSKVARNKREP